LGGRDQKKLREIGEFGFIRSLRARLPRIGDDTAVLPRPASEVLFTTDMLIEGRHFTRARASAYTIGWKAVAVNASDIAAMGGRPLWAVAAAGLPGGTSGRFLRELYRGMLACGRSVGCEIVGGDTNASDRIVLAVAMLGLAPRGGAVRRRGARPGDALYVTGRLGGSYASGKHLRFTPRLAEAAWLAGRCYARAMMDLSDGLASDIRRLCGESGVGARIELARVPRSRASLPVERALGDGEDFELLFAVRAPDAGPLERAWPRSFAKLTRIGTVLEARRGILTCDKAGRETPLQSAGFDHFPGRRR
jgi:thiamine-monophosphate kinase